MMAGFFVAVLAGGRYSDRRGKLPVMAAGCLLMCAGALAFALTDSFGAALGAAMLMGFGGGLAEGIAMAAVSDLYGENRRTAMLLWAQVVFAVGAVSAPFAVARLLASGMNWRIGYAGVAAASFISASAGFAAAALRRERPISGHHAGDGWRVLFTDRGVIWLSVAILLYVGAEAGQSSWLAAYMKGSLGSSNPLAAASVAFLWAGIGAGRVAATWLSKRLSDMALIRGALLLAAIAQSALLLLRGPKPAVLVAFLLGFCLAPVWPTILSVAGKSRPLQSGAVFGIVVAFGALGAAIFPPAIGQLADAVGMRAALWACVLILLADLAVSIRFKSEG